MMAAASEDMQLAPLDALIDILPKIEVAKQRARLGTALQKATAAADRFKHYPELLEGLSILVGASGADLESLRSEIGPTLTMITKVGRVLEGQPTIEALDDVNQVGLTQLPLQVDKIQTSVESAWRKTVREALGGHAALGEILTSIPGVELLGRELTKLARRAASLEDNSRAATVRAAEFDNLTAEASELAGRLLTAGVAPPIANFLAAVAAGPVRLSDLTDDILAWIKDHNALPLFTISAGGA